MSEGGSNGDAGAAASIAGEAVIRPLPIPATVSPQMQKLIGAPANRIWKARPKTETEWRQIVEAQGAAAINRLPAMCERLGVKFERTTIGDVGGYVVAPDAVAPATTPSATTTPAGGGGPDRTLFKRSTYAGVADTGPIAGETHEQKIARLTALVAGAKERAEGSG